MGTGFAKKKKEAKMMREQLTQMQDQMQNMEVTGTAGNGLVTLTLNGDHEMKSIKIKPECVDKEDVEGLEDLIKAAFQDATKKIKSESNMKLPPGLAKGFPGLAGF